MKLSIVTTLFYSAPYLENFYERICSAAKQITDDYEIIFVNDGSPDSSLEIVMDFYKKDIKVKIIDLSRNFGHHKAIMTGLSFAKGDLVFLIDCDLEEEPELLGSFYSAIYEEKCDVVYGVQEKRKGTVFERISGEVFYRLINFLSDMKMPRNIVTVRLMTRRYVDSLLRFKEQELFLAGLFYITGYKQVAIPIRKLSKGVSTYNLRRKVSLLVNSITSFSNKPLKYIFNLGVIISLLSSLYIIYLVIRRIFYAMQIEGWTSLIVSVWLLGGIMLFSLGIFGIYLSKIFIEIKGRPYTIIRDIYERKD